MNGDEARYEHGCNLDLFPSLTKIQIGERDINIQQSTNGNQLYLSIKAHIGVDNDSGFIHLVDTTSVNFNVISEDQLLHGDQ